MSFEYKTDGHKIEIIAKSGVIPIREYSFIDEMIKFVDLQHFPCNYMSHIDADRCLTRERLRIDYCKKVDGIFHEIPNFVVYGPYIHYCDDDETFTRYIDYQNPFIVFSKSFWDGDNMWHFILCRGIFLLEDGSTVHCFEHNTYGVECDLKFTIYDVDCLYKSYWPKLGESVIAV